MSARGLRGPSGEPKGSQAFGTQRPDGGEEGNPNKQAPAPRRRLILDGAIASGKENKQRLLWEGGAGGGLGLCVTACPCPISMPLLWKPEGAECWCLLGGGSATPPGTPKLCRSRVLRAGGRGATEVLPGVRSCPVPQFPLWDYKGLPPPGGLAWLWGAGGWSRIPWG